MYSTRTGTSASRRFWFEAVTTPLNKKYTIQIDYQGVVSLNSTPKTRRNKMVLPSFWYLIFGNEDECEDDELGLG